jgi:hypothetical protein
MLEQLKVVLAAASYPSTDVKYRASGLTQRALDEIAAVGGALTADTGTATTISGAIGLARATVTAQGLTGTFGTAQKQQALGRLNQLGAQLASLGLS